MIFPFQQADPAYRHFQYLEDLSTAYWYSEVLFAALKLRLFGLLEEGNTDLDGLAKAAGCRKAELARLMNVLHRMELVHRYDDSGHEDRQDQAGQAQESPSEANWFNGQLARRFLIPGQSSYLGDYLLYRRYMRPRWDALTKKVSQENIDRQGPSAPDADYETRNYHYVRATDALMRQKAPEILAVLKRDAVLASCATGFESSAKDFPSPIQDDAPVWTPPLLDIGGGAGALSRHLLQNRREGGQNGQDTGAMETERCDAVLFELPETIEAARRMYSEESDWRNITTCAGDFRTHDFGKTQFGLIIMSNFLHAYGATEARELLHKAEGLLRPDGMILIHDYFPDRLGASPQKGALYDVNMMLNTFNGQCHDSAVIAKWLQDAGLAATRVYDLPSDSAVMLSRKTTKRDGTTVSGTAVLTKDTASKLFEKHISTSEGDFSEWCHLARKEGFRRALPVSPVDIVTAPWVRMKCRFGCDLYGKDLQCPPRGMDCHETREMLDSYTHAVLLEGTPPGQEFHERLLRLETKAFLAGFHKAFVFGAGPCTVCPRCPEDGVCRHPDKARPAMEGSGIDVYTTALNAGIHLEPVTDKLQYVKYIGLLLLE